MKNRIVIVLLTGFLALSGTFAGCSGKSAEKSEKYKELGITQMTEGDYESAAASFQKALNQSLGKVGAQEIDVCYYKALAQFCAGDVAGAIETYTALIDYDGDNWKAYYLRGSAYLKNGQSEEGMKDLDQAIALNPQDFFLYAHIYENLAASGYEEQGQQYLQKALQMKAETAEDFAGLGHIYYLQKDYSNALTNLAKAVEKNYDAALLELGQAYAASGKSEEAKSAFEQYMEKYPEDGEALKHLGEIALSAGEYADAAAYFERALEYAGKAEARNIQKNIVAAYEYACDYDRAMDAARDYTSAYPDDAEMQREYEFLKTRVGGTQPTDDGTAEDGSADDGTAEDGSTNDGTAEDGSPDDGTAGDEAAGDGAAEAQ